MPTKLVVWNIQRFGLNKINNSDGADFGERFASIAQSLSNLYHILRIADTADILSVIEVQSSRSVIGSLIGASGASGCLLLLRWLQLNYNAAWRLIPPLKLVGLTDTGEAANYTEGVAVFYRSDRLSFTGPYVWPQNGAVAVPPGPTVTPGPYPAPWADALPVGNTFAGQFQFFKDVARTNEMLFVNGNNRRPWLTTFTEIGGAARTIKLLSVHPSPNSDLFTVKSPADTRQADLTLQYVINELEVPEVGTATIDDYQPSSWLTFIIPISDTRSAIGPVEIPIPLRSYPSPVTLIGQSGTQSVAQPSTPDQLVEWDYAFTYQHLDADQDTTYLDLQFNIGGPTSVALFSEPSLFDALAQFTAVYPQLKNDLALLPSLPTGIGNTVARQAAATFSALVTQVAQAWAGASEWRARRSLVTSATAIPYTYQLERARNEDNALTTLAISALSNPSVLWPDVAVLVGDTFQPLTPVGTPTSTQAIYQYPGGIAADAPLQQRFTFPRQNVIQNQDGWAGVYITRNAGLVSKTPTNPAFVYQTPTVRFSNVMIPFIYSSAEIDIKGSSISLAQALGQFFKALLVGSSSFPPDSTRSIRVACNYGYQLAAPSSSLGRSAVPARTQASSNSPLVAYVPVNLIAHYPFDLSSDWDWTKSESFVSQLAAAVNDWGATNNPSPTNGAYFFDISVFSTLDSSSLQPLLEATSVGYALS